MLALVTAGCMKVDSPELDSPGITLTPVDLFEGEQAKFKSFLGTSGGFKLRYSGEKPEVSLAISKWEDGKKTETYSVLTDVFFVPEGEQEIREVEVIISIDDINFSEQDKFALVKYAVWDESGSSTVSFMAPWKDLSARRVIQYQEPITFAIDGDGSIPVWGIEGISSGKPVRHHDL